MAAVGRPRKPVAQHKLDGTYKPCRHGGGSGDKFPRTKQRSHPPKILSPNGKAKYRELISLFDAVPGLMADVDIDAVAIYAEAWADFVEALEIVAVEGRILISEKGGRYMHPALAMKAQAIKTMRSIGTEFGMSPTARDKIRTLVGEKKESQFTELLKMREAG